MYSQSVEHPETRKRSWVLCIAGRSRKLVRNAGYPPDGKSGTRAKLSCTPSVTP